MEGRRAIRALLVDDDAAYLEVLKFFMERDGGIECDTVTSARQAVEMLSQGEYDAVVSDYLMPEMDGLEFLKVFRLQGRSQPFIMLTGRGREDVAIQALNSGADFYIQKGGDPKAQYTDLCNMVRKSVHKRWAEREVREGEIFQKRLFESVQDGVSVLSKDLVIEKVNPTMERWYAHSMPLVGKRCHEAYHGRSEPCEVCPTVRAIRTGMTAKERVAMVGADGVRTGWFDVYSYPMVDEATGEVERVIEYLRDVTEEEEAKGALVASERKYKSLVEFANEGILAIDRGGVINFANPRMAEMLGYCPGELLGRNIGSFVDRAWRGSVHPNLLHRSLENGERVELPFLRKDGSEATVIVAASPVSSDKGLLEGAMAVVTDISELRSVLEHLASSEEKFAKLFKDSPQMVLISRAADRTILEANGSASRFTGYRRDQLLGRSYTDLGILTDEITGHILSKLADGGMLRDLDVEIVCSSGERRLVRLSAFIITLQGEDCLAFIACDMSQEVAGVRELRRERDVLKAILESSPDGIVITDLEWNLVECNSAILDILGGIPRGRMLGASVLNLMGREDNAKAARIGRKLKSEGVLRGVSIDLVREDGIRINVDISAAVVKDALGMPVYLVGIVRDVTDVVRYQVALEKALDDRRKMASIIDQSPTVAFLWKNAPGWPVEYVSENVLQFGYEAAELTAGVRDFASIVHPDDLERVRQEVMVHIAAGRTEFEQEYRLVSPEGKVFWVYDKTSAVWADDGTIEAFQGVVMDVTQRKEAEARLSRMERQMKMFMDLSPVMKFMKDRDGRYVYVNRRQQAIFQGIIPEWIGGTDADLFPPDIAKKLEAADRAVFEAGSLREFVETIPQEDGPHVYLTYKFLVPSIAGGEDLLAGVAVDLTEERRYEEALKAANEKLGLLGSMTRHDITNQMAVISGWLEIIGETVTDPQAAAQVGEMKAAAESISGLLRFASEYQTLGLEAPSWLPVEETFREGVWTVRPAAVRVDVDVPGTEVYADRMLEGVFRNLMDNSLRHGGKVSRVSLTARREGGVLVLVYEDDGVGVPPDAKERMFERGFGKNTGLGLFMARQALGLTGITISETGEEGKGARFEIRVPEGAHRRSAGKG